MAEEQDNTGVVDEPETPGSEPAASLDLEPMTFSLLSRFFAVPLLIIGTIVGGAVVVVLFFGGPATAPERSVESLLQALEAQLGEKPMGMLLPHEKEVWQAAMELSVRLKKKGETFTAEELDGIADRLATMVRTELADPTWHASSQDQGGKLSQRSTRLNFLIHALGETERPQAVAALIGVMEQGGEPQVRAAMLELGELHDLPEARAAVEPIRQVLRSPSAVETRLVACTVLSVLSRPEDVAVIEALSQVRLGGEGDLAWSAALALARLGSDRGKSTLADLLDRSFLSSGKRYVVVDESGTVHRYPLPPQRIDNVMLAAIDAVSHLSTPGLWETVERLESDPSPVVRASASKALASRGADRGATEPED